MQLHTDLDVGNKNIKYVLAGEGAGTIFAINELTGDIHAMKRLDREEKAEYTLTAQVVNADTDEPLEPPSGFIIKVQDINDNPPQFIEGPYRASVPEMSAVGESPYMHTSPPPRMRFQKTADRSRALTAAPGTHKWHTFNEPPRLSLLFSDDDDDASSHSQV